MCLPKGFLQTQVTGVLTLKLWPFSHCHWQKRCGETSNFVVLLLRGHGQWLSLLLDLDLIASDQCQLTIDLLHLIFGPCLSFASALGHVAV